MARAQDVEKRGFGPVVRGDDLETPVVPVADRAKKSRLGVGAAIQICLVVVTVGLAAAALPDTDVRSEATSRSMPRGVLDSADSASQVPAVPPLSLPADVLDLAPPTPVLADPTATMSDAELLYVIAHEVGHAYDVARITLDDEALWRAARGIGAGTPWWAGPSSPDLATPAGDFAECFAAWSVGSASHSAYGSCAGTGQLVADIALR